MLHGHLAECGPCPYLPDRQFSAFIPQPNPPTDIAYRQLMDQRFRRSGAQLYMPLCVGCTACQPIRVALAGFQPRADQRRCRTRNADLTVSFHARGLDPERLDLYRSYQAAVHGKKSDGDEPSDPASSLVEDGGIPGGELHARDGHGRLLAVSVIDVIGDALSSVYCYYLPAERKRSLGTFMALAEIDHARNLGLNWLYLGFYVAGCSKMTYKARFGPCELLVDKAWVPLSEDD